MTAWFGRVPEWVAGEDLSAGAASGRKLAAAAYLGSRKIVQDLDRYQTEVAQDDTLTDAGKQMQLSRFVRDCQVRLGEIEKHRDTLAAELEKARAAYTPAIAPDDTVNAAIWQRLPDDPMQVEATYRDAIAKQDWRTTNAIESLPSVFPGALSNEKLNTLTKDRIAIEAPEIARSIDVAADYLGLVSSAVQSAQTYVEDVEAELPSPDPNEKSIVGADGLTELSPSQFAEAMG